MVQKLSFITELKSQLLTLLKLCIARYTINHYAATTKITCFFKTEFDVQ